jgi:hypothetical protein
VVRPRKPHTADSLPTPQPPPRQNPKHVMCEVYPIYTTPATGLRDDSCLELVGVSKVASSVVATGLWRRGGAFRDMQAVAAYGDAAGCMRLRTEGMRV